MKYIYNVGYYDSKKQPQETQIDIEETATYDNNIELINLILSLKEELDIQKIEYIDFVGGEYAGD